MDQDTLTQLLAGEDVTVTTTEYDPAATVLEVIQQAATDEFREN